MTPKLYDSLEKYGGNLMAAIDLETTGVRAGYNEIIQIAVVPLDTDMKPLADVRPFYTVVKPNHPERTSQSATAKHGLSIGDLFTTAPDSEKIVDVLCEWFEGLRLPMNRSIIPLAHNWAFESSFLQAWLGVELKDKIFHAHARDSMITAIAINDKAVFAGDPAPFGRVSLATLCRYFKIVNLNPHDALSDCLAEAELYRELLRML